MRSATALSQLQKTFSGSRKIIQPTQSLMTASYVIEGTAKASPRPTHTEAHVWVAKNAFMQEYKAPSIDYNNKSRDITNQVLVADRLNKAGKSKDAQKLYHSAASAMLELKKMPDYEWDDCMKNQFTRVFKKL